jgi:hypothetical protein
MYGVGFIAGEFAAWEAWTDVHTVLQVLGRVTYATPIDDIFSSLANNP